MSLDMNVALKIRAGVNGQQSVDQLRTSMDRLDNAAGSVSKGFGLASTAVKGFLALQAVQAVASFAKGTIDAADNLAKVAAKTGLTVESLSELKFAADLSGSSIDEVQASMTKLAVKATEAATGSKTAQYAFDALGLSVKNSNGEMKDQEQLLNEAASALASIENPTLKAALAVELFGRSGVNLIPFLDTLEKSRKEAQEFGAVVSTEFAASAEVFNDNLTRMSGAASGFAMTVLNDVMPALNGMFNELNVGIKVFGSFSSALYNIGTTNPFKTPTEQAEAYTKEVADLTASIKKLDADGSTYSQRRANYLRDELETAKKLAQYFREIAGIKEAGGGRGFVNPPLVKSDQPDAAAILKKLAGSKASEEADKTAAKVADERRQVLKGLSDEIVKLTQGEEALTIAKLRSLGASDTEIRQAQELMRQRAGILASDRDMETAIKTETKLTEEATRAKEQLGEAGKRVFEETRSPIEKLNVELARLQMLLDADAISMDTFQRASIDAQEAFDSIGAKGKDTMQELKDAIDGWGKQATDAFVDFAFTGKMSFGDMVSSILKDIARMVFQTLVMAPLMAAIKTMLPTAAFANGGIMTGAGPAPLKKYASGGVANTPQLALYGEGSMPEAYVPLPDGRTIPVTMKGGAGGGGVSNVTVNVNVEGGTEDQTSTAAGAAQLGKAIAGAVRMELMQQKRPGGLLAA